jgi:hypothetical protein
MVVLRDGVCPSILTLLDFGSADNGIGMTSTNVFSNEAIFSGGVDMGREVVVDVPTEISREVLVLINSEVVG